MPLTACIDKAGCFGASSRNAPDSLVAIFVTLSSAKGDEFSSVLVSGYE
jgi:hypothetical protein